MTKPKLLIIDDDEAICQQMRWALNGEYEVFLAGDRKMALDLFHSNVPPVVSLDLGLPPNPREASEGLLLLAEILQINPRVKILVVSGNSERANAVKAIEQGAFDFFTKPIEINELRVTLRRALHVFRLEEENRQLKELPIQESDLIGASGVMKKVYKTIRKISGTDIPVLITGESGTGKELVAREIYKQSSRSAGPFVAINCGAIPEHLLESELFGHEKGAFTGAHARRKGRIEYAEGGTLFLDEIGELGLGLQVKLLRFLQESILERIGGRVSLSIDTRVIAATNRDLKEMMLEGAFREDLFYRLNVATISVPPLRDRDGDLLLLARTFISRFSREFGKKVKGLNVAGIKALTTYAWPGNVREMENKIRRAVVMAEGAFLTPDDLELAVIGERVFLPKLKMEKDSLEKELVGAALSRFGGNVTQAADALGISRQRFRELIAKHRIERVP